MPTTKTREKEKAPAEGGEKKPEAETLDPETPEEKMRREFLSLLVAVGGVKGTLAVAAAVFCGVSVFGDVGQLESVDGAVWKDVVLGLACAAPTVAFDGFVMGVDWESRAVTEEEAEDAAKEATGTKRTRGRLVPYYEPLARYQQDETLGNPCKRMPWWMDASVAVTARVADEMLERAIFLGLTARWIADRAVEAGMEPYDAEMPAKFVAFALAYVVLEVRLRRVMRRTRVQAYRVERNKVTGKQTLVPVNESDLKQSQANMDAGNNTSAGGPLVALKRTVSSLFTSLSSPKESKTDAKKKQASPSNKAETQALENILRGKAVKDTLDLSRARLVFITQSIAFVATGNILAPVVGGYCVDALYIRHQRAAMRRFIERALGQVAGEGEDANAAPTLARIRKAQAVAFSASLKRKKARMGRDVLDAMARDPSISRDVNELFQDVVRKTKRVKNMDETTAVDQVLLAIDTDTSSALSQSASSREKTPSPDDTSNDETPPTSKPDVGSVAYATAMRASLERISAELDAFESAAQASTASTITIDTPAKDIPDSDAAADSNAAAADVDGGNDETPSN